MFVGWDWGSTAHDVTVIDSAGARVRRMAIPHTEDGIARAVATLTGYGDPGELPVAIETARGLVVDRLLAVGHPVIPVHPNAFHAVRPGWGAARAKNDPGDSFKLADYARTDIHRLPVLVSTLPETLELQALTRQRDNRLALRIAAVSQLTALLDQHWPGGKTIFAQLHSSIALDFLERWSATRHRRPAPVSRLPGLRRSAAAAATVAAVPAPNCWSVCAAPRYRPVGSASRTNGHPSRIGRVFQLGRPSPMS